MAYGAWREWNGTAKSEEFEDDFLGEWPSVLAYAESLTDDVGLTITVDPSSWESYVRFDHQAFARDLEFELHQADTPNGNVWLFRYR